RSHISGREDVGKEDDLLVIESVRNFDWTNIRARYPRVLCLSSRISAEHVRVAKESGRRIAHHLFGDPCIRIGVVAERPELLLTEKAFAARNSERHHNAVSDFQFRAIDPWSNFHDF